MPLGYLDWVVTARHAFKIHLDFVSHSKPIYEAKYRTPRWI